MNKAISSFCNEGKCSQCITCGEAVGIGTWYDCDCGEGPFCEDCYEEHLEVCVVRAYVTRCNWRADGI